MNEQVFKEKMVSLFADSYFGQDVGADELVLHANLNNDLGLDSLDRVEFLLALEKEFDIRIDDDEFTECVTLGDVFECIKKHGAA